MMSYRSHKDLRWTIFLYVNNIEVKKKYKMSDMKEKMHTGELYLPGDDEIMKEQMKRPERL